MSTATLVYPHQLFAQHPGVRRGDIVLLVEDPLFFRQYLFHRQKLVYQRATLQNYAVDLRQAGYQVEIITSRELSTTADVVRTLQLRGITRVRYVDPCDDWLTQRLTAALAAAAIASEVLPDPHFLTPASEISRWTAARQKFFFTDFYITQRKRLNVLLTEDGRPVGGKWSFDPDNRKKLPRGLPIPAVQFPDEHPAATTAREEVGREFPTAPGSDLACRYPTTRAAALDGLHDFLTRRFAAFGDYEDAISREQAILFHSLLTPALNVGLISPAEIVTAALEHRDRVPLNALEGFVRQIIGWREYMRLVYLVCGRRQRTRNFWGHSRQMPDSFYTGTTGIVPVDVVIRRVLDRAWCHHIERLMILGNFMLLCEIHPDAVYRWFMELFVDAYDWVMVPNVYGMSQHADGGLITTKPYISGSSYVLKMSDFPRGDWCPIWDALYWRFVDRHRDFFEQNPRMAVMTSQLDRMGSKLATHHRTAETFLERLHA